MRSRFRIQCQANGSEIKASDHGWNAVLDGTRSRQAEGIRRESGRLVIRNYGDRDDRERTPLPGRRTAQGFVLDRHKRNTHSQEAGEAKRRAQAFPLGLLMRRREKSSVDHRTFDGELRRGQSKVSTPADQHDLTARVLEQGLWPRRPSAAHEKERQG